VLLIGVPGLAKTLLVETWRGAGMKPSASSSRRPDAGRHLGSEVLEEGDTAAALPLHPGPVFAQC